MIPSRSPRTKATALAALGLIWLAFHFPSFAGRVLFPSEIQPGAPSGSVEAVSASNPLETDAYTLYYPLRSYLSERLREGEIPLWDPHRFSGLPFAANSQAAVWYPLNWLFSSGDVMTVYSLLIAVSRLVAMLLAYWFFRILHLHPYAAVIGATVFVFSGFMLAWAEHATFLASGMWLPLALGGVTLALKTQPRRGLILGSVGLALSILGGHPQVTIFVWIATISWGGVLAIASLVSAGRTSRPQVLRRALRSLWLITGTLSLGIGLASLQVLSSWQFGQHTIRGVESYTKLSLTH